MVYCLVDYSDEQNRLNWHNWTTKGNLSNNSSNLPIRIEFLGSLDEYAVLQHRSCVVCRNPLSEPREHQHDDTLLLGPFLTSQKYKIGRLLTSAGIEYTLLDRSIEAFDGCNMKCKSCSRTVDTNTLSVDRDEDSPEDGVLRSLEHVVPNSYQMKGLHCDDRVPSLVQSARSSTEAKPEVSTQETMENQLKTEETDELDTPGPSWKQFENTVTTSKGKVIDVITLDDDDDDDMDTNQQNHKVVHWIGIIQRNMAEKEIATRENKPVPKVENDAENPEAATSGEALPHNANDEEDAEQSDSEVPPEIESPQSPSDVGDNNSLVDVKTENEEILLNNAEFSEFDLPKTSSVTQNTATTSKRKVIGFINLDDDDGMDTNQNDKVVRWLGTIQKTTPDKENAIREEKPVPKVENDVENPEATGSGEAAPDNANDEEDVEQSDSEVPPEIESPQSPSDVGDNNSLEDVTLHDDDVVTDQNHEVIDWLGTIQKTTSDKDTALREEKPVPKVENDVENLEAAPDNANDEEDAEQPDSETPFEAESLDDDVISSLASMSSPSLHTKDSGNDRAEATVNEETSFSSTGDMGRERSQPDTPEGLIETEALDDSADSGYVEESLVDETESNQPVKGVMQNRDKKNRKRRFAEVLPLYPEPRLECLRFSEHDWSSIRDIYTVEALSSVLKKGWAGLRPEFLTIRARSKMIDESALDLRLYFPEYVSDRPELLDLSKIKERVWKMGQSVKQQELFAQRRVETAHQNYKSRLAAGEVYQVPLKLKRKRQAERVERIKNDRLLGTDSTVKTDKITKGKRRSTDSPPPKRICFALYQSKSQEADNNDETCSVYSEELDLPYSEDIDMEIPSISAFKKKPQEADDEDDACSAYSEELGLSDGDVTEEGPPTTSKPEKTNRLLENHISKSMMAVEELFRREQEYVPETSATPEDPTNKDIDPDKACETNNNQDVKMEVVTEDETAAICSNQSNTEVSHQDDDDDDIVIIKVITSEVQKEPSEEIYRLPETTDEPEIDQQQIPVITLDDDDIEVLEVRKRPSPEEVKQETETEIETSNAFPTTSQVTSKCNITCSRLRIPWFQKLHGCSGTAENRPNGSNQSRKSS